jgi:hypothetical protein
MKKSLHLFLAVTATEAPTGVFFMFARDSELTADSDVSYSSTLDM